jgi:uncharacterized protein YndB with AHSA1/START domain
MGREFANRHDAQVAATPEQVWDAIATGPGVSSWFIGRTEIDGAGAVRTAFGDDWIPAGHVTVAQPPTAFAYTSDPAPDSRVIAYEYLIEGRAGGSTVLRAMTSGFLPGDEWAAEYEAMTYGTALFFATLVEYLGHFAGRTAVPVTAFGPPVADWHLTWARLHADLGLDGPPGPGDRVRLHDGDGVVYFTNPHTLGVRTEDAMYRFIRGLHGGMVAGHHLFGAVTAADSADAWQAWLTHLDRKDPS